MSEWWRAPLDANRPWLDGSYDRALVEECPHHPDHRWWIYRVGDLKEYPRDPEEKMVLCEACRVPRCGYSTEPNPCVLPRHHQEWHRLADGREIPSGKDSFVL